MRTGTPFNSYSANFHPGFCLSSLSYFTAISFFSACKSFIHCLYSFDYRRCHPLLGELRVYIQHLLCFMYCLLFCCMCSVSFLPKKFCGSQKQSRAHFPSHNVCPLINE